MNDTLRYLQTFASFPFSLGRFVRDVVPYAAAEERVRAGMLDRKQRFLKLLSGSIFANPGSPYRTLLEHAGIRQSDIAELLEKNSLEDTLRELRRAGVYVTYEELKGRKPIVRGSLTLTPLPRDFDNPIANRDFSLTTGGSTGVANAVYQDLDHVAALAINERLLLRAHGFLQAPTLHWTHMLPGSGLRFIMQRAHHGERLQTWFSPVGWRDFAAWAKYDAATLYMLLCLRLQGIRVGLPQIVRPHEARIVARKMRDVLDSQGHCLLYANVSQALRVALAATEAGFDLKGAAARLMAEPLTEAKAERIRASGMKTIGGYGSIETGAIGIGCGDPAHVDDVHLLMDAFALFDYPYTIAPSGTPIPAFNLTSLRMSSPKVMLNYQIDDYGIVETRKCRCPLNEFGYAVHLHHIRSYGKFVGAGATLIGDELLKILEEQLPARFGGSPLDYQWIEKEDAQGLTRLVLLIDPSVPLADEAAVIPFVLDALRRASGYTDAARAMWESARTLQVERRAPILTARSKLLPLHLPH